jgi:hypothetical protein
MSIEASWNTQELYVPSSCFAKRCAPCGTCGISTASSATTVNTAVNLSKVCRSAQSGQCVLMYIPKFELKERQARSVKLNMVAALGMIWWVMSDLGRKPAVTTECGG